MTAETLAGFDIAEEALRDAVALLTVEITGTGVETRVESRRIVASRDGETEARRAVRIISTLDLVGTLASQAFSLAAGLLEISEGNLDDDGSPLALVQRYATRLARSEPRRRAIFYREFDPNYRPPGMVNYYCPACECRKSGYRTEPNRRDEGCSNEGCVCHDEDFYPEEIA